MPEEGTITDSFTRFLRRKAKIRCPISSCGEEIIDIDDRLASHLQTAHPDLLAKNDLIDLLRRIRRDTWGGATSKE